MTELVNSVKRNFKLFFKDKGLFFTSLITPLILLVLYVFFLARIYKGNFQSAFADFAPPDKILNGLVAGQLMSSMLAVSCVTVAFGSNMLMVMDKVTGARGDLLISPVKKSTLALSYYISTVVTTLFISLIGCAACLIYVGATGWCLSVGDVFLILSDVVLLVLFGTALSSIVNLFLSSQGQISAVGTVVSAGYGFICGAYMPIHFFGSVLQNILCFLPGTYGTSLIRSHCIRGALSELSSLGVDASVITEIKQSIDSELVFFGNAVAEWASYLVLILSIVALVTVYVLLNVFRGKKKK